MGKKIFITYKYSDSNVRSLNPFYQSTARDYVDVVQNLIDKEDHINKGELDGEDLSQFKDGTIESKLRDKIYDSSITLVLISRNMKDLYLHEVDQWMPWEISYSLKELTRDGRTSRSNALLAVALPDINGYYDYFIQDNTCSHCNCRTLVTPFLFKILKDNMFNIKNPEFTDCPFHSSKPMKGYSSYIHSVKWEDFILDVNKYFNIAIEINGNIENYNIVKEMD